jgi:hypothetical protein
VFRIKCEYDKKEGRGPRLRKGFLRKEGRKSLMERRGGLEALGTLEELG